MKCEIDESRPSFLSGFFRMRWHVFVKTPDGIHEILVNARTGKIEGDNLVKEDASKP